MLVELRVRDLVLIEALDLELSPGFTALTGETGAGKSLVATAVGLLLGRKLAGDLVRRGAETAEVEGLFDISDEPAARAALAEAGLPADAELLVRRVVPADGRQRCFINGRLASLAVLEGISRGLASFAGQHEHLALLEPARQLALLDLFAGIGEEVDRMAVLAAAAGEARTALDRLREAERDRAERLSWLTFQLEEIDRLAPRPGELEELERTAARLRHREDLTGAARRALLALYEEEGSAFERIGAAARDLARAGRHDETLAEVARPLEEAAAILEEAARALGDYAGEDEDEPARLEEVEDRRAALAALERKHGQALGEIVARREALAAEAADLEGYDEARARAMRGLEEARDRAGRHAAALSARRRKAAKGLAAAVDRELADLALAGASFSVALEPAGGDPGATGSDRVEFTVSLNPGEGAHPLRRVASGGELSRVMLALRRALAGVGPVGSYVFDEVDAGIGGAQAALVGRKLREVAAHHQVVCVTHLPQIAGLAHEHFRVVKTVRDGRTSTEVRRLEGEERVQEIARMLGGERLTERTVAAARELLAAR